VIDELILLQALDAGMPLAQIERMNALDLAVSVLGAQVKMGEAALPPFGEGDETVLEQLRPLVDFFEGTPRTDMPPPPGFACEWKGMHFRSKTERRVAQALDRANVAFFPNARGRLGVGADHRENREPDFLVIADGKIGIFEVDGDDFHPPDRASADHDRDRLFRRQGIRVVERFSAVECWEDSDRVVAEFLRLLDLNG
jgi:hypothetical protein